MVYIERDGVRIYYEDHGSGPAVLLSHGFNDTADMWKGQVEALADRYRVIIWDMRGHGRTDSPDDPALYSEASTIDDMAAILGHLGVERAVIGGHSMGGFMSLAFRLKYAPMVRALILFGTGPGYRNPTGREGWNQTAFARAKSIEERGLREGSKHRSAAGLAKAARGMLAQFDGRVIESLPNITVPTLVLVGAKDEAFLASSEYMAAKIPGAQAVVIPDAGHGANSDQPAAFNAAVVEFLPGVPG